MARALDPLSPEQLLADSRWLRSLARGLAGESGADDLVSETWLTAARRPPRFWDNLRPWLRTVARNLSLRERDREARRREREARAARPEGEPSTADLVGRATLRRSVVDAVLELSEPYRTTILLRFFEELPPREVARRLGVPVATVRTRISRGLAQLRSRLDREQGGSPAWIALLVPAKGLLGILGVTGAIVMGTKAKVGAAAIVLLLGALGWWQWSRVTLPADAPAGSASPVQPAAAAAAPASAPVATSATATRAIRPQRSVEEKEKTFAIVGTLVDDRNDRPVEGVVARHMGWGLQPETVATAATTDREGKFRVPIHEKNRILGLTFLSPEYAPLVVDHMENQVRLEHGETLDLGRLELLRGARVRGRVVRAEAKEPIPDAQLFVCPRGYPVTQSLLPEARPVGRSAADGTFTLSERVAPNQHQEAILCAVTPEGVGWTFLAIVKDREDLGDVEIVVSRGAAVRVTVVDEDERPIEGAFVHAVPRFPPLGPPRSFGPDYGGYVLDQAQDDFFSKKTGSDGVVSFRELPVGRTEDRFKQYASPNAAYDFRAFHKDYVFGAPLVIDVDPTSETTTTIKLARRTLCAIHGRVTNESGAPLEGARIGQPHAVAVLATTDGDGAYRTAGQDTSYGKAWLEARADGYARVLRKVDLSTKGEDVVADFVLERATPIKGRVIDQFGKPVTAAYVDLLDGNGQNRRQLRPDGNGELAEDGRFVFSEATAGPWTMRVRGEPNEDWISPRERIVQGGDQNVEVVLRRRAVGRAKLDAEIVDATSGAPVDPAEAHLRMVAAATFSMDSIATARPKSSAGRVTAEKLRPGRWELFVRVADGSRVTREFTVKPEDTLVKLRVEVGKPAMITVRIDLGALAEDARPASVSIWTLPGDAAQWMSRPGVPAPQCSRGAGLADASNGWTILFGDVTPGVPITFWTSSQGGMKCRAEGVVTVGFGEEKEITLKPVVSAKVSFVKPDDAPPGGVVVSVRRADGSWDQVNWETLWEEGKAWKTDREVIPGRVSWRAERYALDADPTERVALATVEGELDVAPGGSREVRIVFPSAGR